MKYSIRGTLNITDEQNLINTINNYTVWKLVTNKGSRRFDDSGDEIVTFEVWVNSLNDKDNLFNDLKTYVDKYGEKIDSHECTHDEPNPTSCVIAEEYRGV